MGRGGNEHRTDPSHAEETQEEKTTLEEQTKAAVCS